VGRPRPSPQSPSCTMMSPAPNCVVSMVQLTNARCSGDSARNSPELQGPANQSSPLLLTVSTLTGCSILSPSGLAP